jgi:predicted MPP superfamily phosphohydrolase
VRSRLSLLLFISVAVGIMGSSYYYLWARLVRDPGMPGAWGIAATLVIAMLGVAQISMLLLRLVLSARRARMVQMALFIWMGIGFLWISSLGLADLTRLSLHIATQLGAHPTGLLAALATPRGVAFAGSTLALLATFAGLYGGFRRPRLKEVRVSVPGLPEELRDLAIVQLSDVHVGPTIDRHFLERIVQRVNLLSPDLVVITGDLVDGSVAQLRGHIAPLADLKARHGVFFIPGNHEYYSGIEEWLLHLTSLGLKVLRNEGSLLGDGASAFFVAGVDDHSAARFDPDLGPDLAKALENRPEGLPVVLLAHQPRDFAKAAAAGVTLQLSGHTHGGQLFPFHLLVWLTFKHYLAGLHRLGNSYLYVSRGTGFWGPPLRLGAPSEITRLTLHPA